MEQGHYAEACRKLEESQRIDPGGGTMLNVALCHEKEGRTATAWAEFTEALGLAKRDDRPQRIEFARVHIAQLDPLLSRLIIQVPRAVDVPDLEIKRDGSSIGRAAWGSAMPVDPGDHLLEASAPGKISWKQIVNVGSKADSRTVVLPILENAPAIAQAAPTGTLAAAPIPTTTPVGLGSSSDTVSKGIADSSQGETRSAGPTPAAWVALGVGLVATGAGAYFGLRAVSEKKDADRNCPNNACNGEGARQNDQAIKWANFATGGFAVGIVGLGLGTYLLVAGSSSPRGAAPSASPESGTAAGSTARVSGLTVSTVGASIGRGTAGLTVSGGW
jgi:hypothetical protein